MPKGNRGHGPGRIVEKPKDFKSAVNRLLKELSTQKTLLIISCFLAMVGSILSIVAPNRLSKLTDEITKGLVVNQKNMTKLTKKITSNLNTDDFKEKLFNSLNPNLNNENIREILSTDEITDEDKRKFKEIIENDNREEIIYKLKELPDILLKRIFTESKYNNTTISSSDKITLIKSLDNNITNINLPQSFQNIIFKEIIVDKIKISSNDQYEYLKIISTLNKDSKPNVIYKKIDNMPKSIQKLIKPKMNIDRIKKITLFMIVLYLTSTIFNFTQQIIMAILSNKFANSLRKRISIKINKLPLKYFDTHQSGDILSRVTNDVDTIAQTMNQSLASLVSSITLFLGSLLMMFITNWIMALTAIGSTIIGFLGMIFILSKSQKFFKERQEELGNLNGHIEEVYSGLNVVRAYNGDEEADRKFNEYNKKVCESNKKSQFISGLMQPLMGFIGNFGYVAVCIVGALLTMNDVITFGVIVAFMTYIRLFTQPLSQIAQGLTSLQSASAASERVFEFIDEDEMQDETNIKTYLKKDKVKGDIKFENVSFRYDGNERNTINNFTAHAKPGQKIAIVGPTGAGKTTMVNLLMKFYEITDGDIKIDDVSTKLLTRGNVHELFTMVLQDTWVFDGTIKENIAFNRDNISDQEIEKICKEVGLDHFIKTLSNGYDTKLSDNESISAGQKQLLTIARGMTENSPFLILDEATSNVDTRTEELVQIAMDKLTKGKTSFIIAHRLSTIKNADLILVMDKGNIIEQGSHDKLIKQNGFYKKLYNSQFEK